MSAPALISAVMLLGLFHPYRSTLTQTYGEGEWVLTVKTDTFTQEIRCDLVDHHRRNPDVTVVREALAFHFNHNLDTSSAWYQIDGGPPKPTRNTISKLVATGSLTDAEQLDNFSSGVVLIPLDELKGAKMVAIQPVPYSTPRQVKLGKMSAMLGASSRLGCRFEELDEKTK